jgi:hypothetical protein
MLVDAAVHEIDVSIAAWESVRRPDQDEVLVRNINQARVDTTFSVIRQALHTQVLMALARLWDRGQQPIGFNKIAVELQKADVSSALIARAAGSAESRLAETRDARTGNFLSVANPVLFQALRDRLPETKALAAKSVELGISDWLHRYQSYVDHRIGDGLHELRTLRDKRVAHWDLSDIENGAQRTYRLHHLGRILRASEILTEQALLLSRDDHLRFIETHRLYNTEAEKFWTSIRSAARGGSVP